MMMTKSKVSRLDHVIEELAALRCDLRRKWCAAQNEAIRDLILDSEHRVCQALNILQEEKDRNQRRLRPVAGRLA